VLNLVKTEHKTRIDHLDDI